MDAAEEQLKQKLLEQQMAKQQLQGTVKPMIAKMLDKKARERLANIRAVKPELALQLEVYLAQLFQSGQVKELTEEQLINILKTISAKREIKIKRK
jgi:programmed cell death protein 5